LWNKIAFCNNTRRLRAHGAHASQTACVCSRTTCCAVRARGDSENTGEGFRCT
jgi:hypothetical protein